MTARAYIVSLFLIGFAGAAAAQTQPTIPPASPPQIAPKAPVPAGAPAPASQLQAEFAVAVGDTVLFPYQSNDLTLRSIKILDNQVNWLKSKPDVRVTIEAYCDDDIDPKQAREFCLNRARAVRDYFVKQGLPNDRMSLIAFDDTQAPKRPSKNADAKKAKKNDKARRTNRRVSTRVAL